MKNQKEDIVDHIELSVDECENQEGLSHWKNYEIFLAQGNKKLAENFRKHAISLWESAVKKGNANAMINLAVANFDQINLALWLMSKVFSTGINITEKNNLLKFTFEKPGFGNNKIKVESFLNTFLNENRHFFLLNPLRAIETTKLKKNLCTVLTEAAKKETHEEIIEISFQALRKYTANPRVLSWFFRLLSEKAKIVSFSESERLGFLLEALDHFVKFISISKITFEKIEFYGKVLFQDIDRSLAQLTIPSHKQTEINWHNAGDAQQTILSYKELITHEQKILSLEKRLSPRIQLLLKHTEVFSVPKKSKTGQNRILKEIKEETLVISNLI